MHFSCKISNQMSLPHTAHQIGALQFQLQKILFGTSQKCRDGQQTLISCTSFQILHLQLAVLFQTKSPMSTFSVSGPKILSHIMPRSADDDTVYTDIFESRQAFYTPENNNKPCLYLIAKWTQISSFAINIHHKHLYESLTSQATYLKEHLLLVVLCQ